MSFINKAFSFQIKKIEILYYKNYHMLILFNIYTSSNDFLNKSMILAIDAV